ncbi:MAG: tagaturonate reductase [Lentisphaeria bacterium]|jgi:tagaturonate reductase
MPRLTRNFLATHPPLPATLECAPLEPPPPVRILQFGEGNFLRAFVDWMVDILNGRGLFTGAIQVVQPIRQGLVPLLNGQDGLYTLLLRGIQDGQTVESRRLVTSIRGGLNPYEDWAGFLAAARNPDLRFVFSNTTEAGIAYQAEPAPRDACPESFPAKLAALLRERFQAFAGAPEKGLVVLPCELIEKNGATLREAVRRQLQAWGAATDLRAWVERHCLFCNTLVDRIVPGYPKTEAAAITAALGYEDALLDTGEIFHLWVIEGPASLAAELPFHQAGLNVVWTDDLTPYRTRKVRVLNGAHTANVLAAFLAGLDTVGEMMADPLFGKLVRDSVFAEILPGLQMAAADKAAYAEAVLERFRNPFIRHELLAISLNSVAKWKVRVLPSLADFLTARQRLPPRLAFSLAALIAFYRGEPAGERELRGLRNGKPYPIRDDQPVLDFFTTAWRAQAATGDATALAKAVLGHIPFWGQDLNALPGLTAAVASHLCEFLEYGMGRASRRLLEL